METHAFAIDMTNNIFAPALIAIWISVKRLHENELWMHISAGLCLFQILLLYVGLFSPRGSIDRVSLYNSIMPALTHWCTVFSFTLMPLLVIAINIVAIQDAKIHYPFLIFVMLV